MAKSVTLSFTKPGMQTLIQDRGRAGQQSSGVPIGGAMDQTSARIANWLVGNDQSKPVLEMTLLGPELIIDNDCQIALTGGDLSPKLNNVPVKMYTTVNAKKGDKLSFGQLVSGCRSYLSIGGTWQVKPWLQSCSAASHSANAFTPESVIQKGQELKIIPNQKPVKRAIPHEIWSNHPQEIKVGILPGPEYNWFSESTLKHFYEISHTIGIDSNRMGYRVETELQDYQSKAEVISSGVFPGTIQITNQGKPIILMADAQTTGGYPRIGNVISAHMDRLAQLRPGGKVRFISMTLKEAYQALKDEENTLSLFGVN